MTNRIAQRFDDTTMLTTVQAEDTHGTDGVCDKRAGLAA
jgi:hypothetical protein